MPGFLPHFSRLSPTHSPFHVIGTDISFIGKKKAQGGKDETKAEGKGDERELAVVAAVLMCYAGPAGNGQRGAVAASVLLDCPLPTEYIPGFLGLREEPGITHAVARLTQCMERDGQTYLAEGQDANTAATARQSPLFCRHCRNFLPRQEMFIFCDGNGKFHPKGVGLGVVVEEKEKATQQLAAPGSPFMATVGVAKSFLYVPGAPQAREIEQVREDNMATAPRADSDVDAVLLVNSEDGQAVAGALWSGGDTVKKPVYVSLGHDEPSVAHATLPLPNGGALSLRLAMSVVARTSPNRVPDPIRVADQLSRSFIRERQSEAKRWTDARAAGQMPWHSGGFLRHVASALEHDDEPSRSVGGGTRARDRVKVGRGVGKSEVDRLLWSWGSVHGSALLVDAPRVLGVHDT